MHESGLCPHPNKLHTSICGCSCECYCFVKYEILNSENLKKNLTFLLASSLPIEIKYSLLLEKFLKTSTSSTKKFGSTQRLKIKLNLRPVCTYRGKSRSPHLPA